MKFIRLMRVDDIHGNSGTGCVVTGVINKSGKVVYWWKNSEINTITIADSVTQVETLHEHGGKGRMEIFDTEKFNSLRELDRFLAGESMKEIEKKMKKKYIKLDEKLDEEPVEDFNGTKEI